MKVLMLTSSYPTKHSNLGPFIENIAIGLKKIGLDIGVLTFSKTKKYKVYKKKGITIYEYPYTLFFPPLLHKNQGLIPSLKASNIAKIQFFEYVFSSIKYLTRISKKYDIIHAHWYIPSGFVACITKANIKKPIITTAWGAEFHLPNNIVVRQMLRFVNNNSDKTVAVSQYMKKRARLYGLDTKNIEVIPNSTDLKVFSIKRKKKNKLIIATVRRLVPEKRIQDLITAYAKIDRNDTELWIIGEGPEKQRLKELTKRLSIQKSTKFLGLVPHSKIPNLLSKIDICVNPSIQEGMATINIESMAAGCITIATNGYGNNEVISSGINGFLYQAKNVSSLKKILIMLIRDKQLRKRISKNAIKSITQFSIEKISNKYLGIYNSVIK